MTALRVATCTAELRDLDADLVGLGEVWSSDHAGVVVDLRAQV